jgi:hypothetical protein
VTPASLRVGLRGEDGGELLGGGPVRAGGMPPASLPTGERVDALVDHDVEPPALGDDVALHPDLPRPDPVEEPE